MEPIDILADRVHQAAAELIQLKKRNRQLVSELDILRKDLRNYQGIKRELDQHRRIHDQMRIKLEKLQRKLSSYLRAPEAKKPKSAVEAGV